MPGVAGLVAAILGTAVIAWAGYLAATVAGAIAVVALECWLIIYARISAPINSRLTAASQGRVFLPPAASGCSVMAAATRLVWGS